jgi:hypothetical protein
MRHEACKNDILASPRLKLRLKAGARKGVRQRLFDHRFRGQWRELRHDRAAMTVAVKHREPADLVISFLALGTRGPHLCVLSTYCEDGSLPNEM